MNPRSAWVIFLAVAAVLWAGVFVAAPPAAAGEHAREGVPAPEITRGKGERCVADTDVMRRDHMRLLRHQRDDTVRSGVRGGRFSLKECVACHAAPGADGRPVSVAAPKQFCRECHDFAAVTIDCFQCHASRPESPKRVSRASGNALKVREGIAWR